MGARGPKPVPAAVLEARGSTLAKARAAGEPAAPPGLPVRPNWHASDGGVELLEIWDWLVAQLTAMKLISSADQQTMEHYCRLVVAARRATETKELLACVAAVQAISDRYGLNPSARARMAITVSQLKADAPKLVSTSEKYRGKKRGVA